MRDGYSVKIFVLSLLAGLVPTNVTAQSTNPAWVSDALIKKSLDDLGDFYADVPSAVNCKNAKTMAERLICGNPYLQQAELLNTRADVYATENATKRQINHEHFRGIIPRACTSENCIYEYFKAKTNDSLGGESPYYNP
jgi:hypothetical protein